MSPRARRSAPLSRRGLPSLLLASLLVTVAGIQLAVPSGSTAATVEPVRTDGESVVQIVSHPDDDLFFMNPDLSQSLRSGHSLASVYLTAGEADGINAPRGRKYKGIPLPAADKARYAEARQNGIRAAYAEMATGDRTGDWQRSAIRTDGGGWAELDTLKARPEVNLVWLQLHEAGSSTANRPHSLHGLWDGRVERLASELSSGTPVTENYTYSKDQVEQTITGVLKRFEPTFVRMLDPTNGRIPNPHLYPDHQDHMYGARFAQRALARYGEVAGHPHFTVQNYLGYLNGRLPHVLDPAALRDKLRILKTYAWSEYPSNYCDAEAGCGDRKVAARPAGHGWAPGIRYSRNTGTSWLQSGSGGELWAFSVLDTRVAVWHRPPGDQGGWSGPKLLPGAGMDSGVVSEKLPDGRIALFATRTSFDGPAGYRRDVVTAAQRRPGGAFGPWRSLGMPRPPGAARSLDISEPAVAADHMGRATVYLRDGGHALSSRAQRPDGSWAPWRAIGGRTVYGDPVVATDRAGRQYVFAHTLTSSLAWTQDAPGAPLRGPVATGLPASTLPMTVRADGDGVRLFFRKPGSGTVLAARFTGGATSYPATVTDLGGRAGFGPVGATGTGGPGAGSKGMRGTGAKATGTLLAARDGSGHLGTAVLSGDAAGRPRWQRGDFLFAGAPAATTDPSGSSCVAAVGLDGRLYWSSRGAGDREAAAWQPVGPAPDAAGAGADTR
ncbi:PIG-L family deacetylase [Streptomyces sp. H27-C3]|uniref:PIG-L family deacetylase n=1 Tax=Streptomyces sp. H27-C3 TaxID=3046305 RepID=UPI0024B99CB6|nr:PIG-L family deacetylase [Streptomyces sp. H27-C3]MDJ0466832.1 PIG-L family deacetylase [Streptomyces sp. H27-C3]